MPSTTTRGGPFCRCRPLPAGSLISPGGRGARGAPSAVPSAGGWRLAPDHVAAPVSGEQGGAVARLGRGDGRGLGLGQRLAGPDRVPDRGLAPEAVPLLGLVALV